MQFLLDTHTLIWFFSGNSHLSDTVRVLIENTEHQKFISMASMWEMAIKQSKGKLTLSLPLENYIRQKLKLEDFEILAIELNHIAAIATLPFHHNDPFDRLLIVQSMVENLPILSKDIAFDAYPVKRIWNK